MSTQFNKKPTRKNVPNNKPKGKQANVLRIPPFISPRLSKSVLTKLKKKNQVSTLYFQLNKLTYMQASISNVKDIIKIKDVFLKLSTNKVSEIYKLMNNLSQKEKPKLNIITKSPLNKQVIILIGSNNFEKVIIKASTHVSNINKLLKSVKSEISIDFI